MIVINSDLTLKLRKMISIIFINKYLKINVLDVMKGIILKKLKNYNIKQIEFIITSQKLNILLLLIKKKLQQ